MSDEQRDSPAGEGTPVGLDAAVAFQSELYLYWRHVHDAVGLPLIARGFVTRPALRGIREVLERAGPIPHRRDPLGDAAEGDDQRLLYVRRLLERLGLLRVEREAARLVAADRSEMERFLAHPLAERLRICARLWVAGAWWSEHLDPRVDLPRLLAPAPPQVALARRRAIDLLAAHAIGDLISIPAPERQLSKHPRRKASHLRHHQMADPSSRDERLRDAMLGPLAWMGFAVPNASAPERSVWVGIGMVALATADNVASHQDALVEQAGRVVVQADLSLVAYPPLTAPLLLTLDTCAERVALDVVARYRLSQEATARARAAGWETPKVITSLEALTGERLPTNVAATLADWERHAARLRLTQDAVILRVREAGLLDAMLTDRTARAWFERRLTPTAALVITGHAARVRLWLLRRGELPTWRHAPQRDDGNGAGDSQL